MKMYTARQLKVDKQNKQSAKPHMYDGEKKRVFSVVKGTGRKIGKKFFFFVDIQFTYCVLNASIFYYCSDFHLNAIFLYGYFNFYVIKKHVKCKAMKVFFCVGFLSLFWRPLNMLMYFFFR